MRISKERPLQVSEAQKIAQELAQTFAKTHKIPQDLAVGGFLWAVHKLNREERLTQEHLSAMGMTTLQDYWQHRKVATATAIAPLSNGEVWKRKLFLGAQLPDNWATDFQVALTNGLRSNSLNTREAPDSTKKPQLFTPLKPDQKLQVKGEADVWLSRQAMTFGTSTGYPTNLVGGAFLWKMYQFRSETLTGEQLNSSCQESTLQDFWKHRKPISVRERTGYEVDYVEGLGERKIPTYEYNTAKGPSFGEKWVEKLGGSPAESDYVHWVSDVRHTLVAFKSGRRILPFTEPGLRKVNPLTAVRTKATRRVREEAQKELNSPRAVAARKDRLARYRAVGLDGPGADGMS